MKNHFLHSLLFSLFSISLLLCFSQLHAQQKVLFDATKAETANNADWVIDADQFNLGYPNGNPKVNSGGEANPQRFPSPDQANITANTKESYWTGALSAWGIDLVKQGFSVETLPYNGQITYGSSSNPQDLSNYAVFVVDEPNIQFTASEKTAILQFVYHGGGLFMISDHDRSDRNGDGIDSPSIWNDLMQNNSFQKNPFGFTFDLKNFSDKTENIPNLPGDPLLHGPMGDVTRVEFYNGTSMTLNTSANSSVKGIVYHSGSSFGNSNVMAAYAEFGKGKVVALGDSSPADDGSGDRNDHLYDGWIEDANGNHERLIMNGTLWLAKGQTTSVKNIAEPKNLIRFKNLHSQLSVSLKGITNFPDNILDIFNMLGQKVESVKNLKPQQDYTIQLPAKGFFIYRFRDFRQTLDWGKFYF
jgi:hypothetical protein